MSINRTLSTAMATGGRVFVEPRSSSAMFDDGRVEEPPAAARRIRVVVGDTTGFAHTADLSEAGSGPQLKRRCGRPRGWR